jgi:hypothetical protein
MAHRDQHTVRTVAEENVLPGILVILHHVRQADGGQAVSAEGEADGREMIRIELLDERQRGLEVGAGPLGPLRVVLRFVHQIPEQHAAIVAMRADHVCERALPARGGVGRGEPLLAELEADDEADAVPPARGEELLELLVIGRCQRAIGLEQPRLLDMRRELEEGADGVAAERHRQRHVLFENIRRRFRPHPSPRRLTRKIIYAAHGERL